MVCYYQTFFALAHTNNFFCAQEQVSKDAPSLVRKMQHLSGERCCIFRKGHLSRLHQVLLHDKQGDDLLSLLVHELRHELMGMIDDLLRLVWMVYVVIQTLL